MSVVVRWLVLCFDCAQRTERCFIAMYSNPELVLKLKAEMFVVIGLEWKIACLIRRHIIVMWHWLTQSSERNRKHLESVGLGGYPNWQAVQCKQNSWGPWGGMSLFANDLNWITRSWCWQKRLHSHCCLLRCVFLTKRPPQPPHSTPSPPLLFNCSASPPHAPQPIGNSHLLAVCFPVNIA